MNARIISVAFFAVLNKTRSYSKNYLSQGTIDKSKSISVKYVNLHDSVWWRIFRNQNDDETKPTFHVFLSWSCHHSIILNPNNWCFSSIERGNVRIKLAYWCKIATIWARISYFCPFFYLLSFKWCRILAIFHEQKKNLVKRLLEPIEWFIDGKKTSSLSCHFHCYYD